MFHTACIRYLDHLDHVDAPARLQLVSTPVSWNVDEKKGVFRAPRRGQVKRPREQTRLVPF